MASSLFASASNQVAKALGTKATVKPDSPGGAVSSKPTMGSIKSGSAAKTVETTITPAQPSITPQAGFNRLSDMSRDAYRSGGFDVPGGDSMPFARTLGEAEEDSIATISITTQIGDSLQSQVDKEEGSVEGDVINAYSRFFLQRVQEAQTEKYQVVETFTAFYTFFYGRRPSIYNYSGMLLNDENHNWANDMQFFYENYFRGTKAAEMQAQAVLTYDGKVVSGFIIDLNIQQESSQDKGVAFSMNLLVTDHVVTDFSVDVNALINNARAALKTQAEAIAQQIAVVNRSASKDDVHAAGAAAANKAKFSSVSATKKNLGKNSSKGK